MKLLIYNFLLRTLTFVFACIGKNVKFVVFESVPDFSGSPKMICLELEKRGFRSKYQFVWAVDQSQKCIFRNFRCVPFWGRLNFFERLKKNFIVWNAVLVVDSNRAIIKQNKKTFRLFTYHGAPLKNCLNATKGCGEMDFCLALSSAFAEEGFRMYKNHWVSKQNQFVVLGYPSNDELFEDVDLSLFWKKSFPRLEVEKFSKIVGWMPTFRQRKRMSNDDTMEIFPYGIPIVKNREDLDSLNGFLKEKNVLLLVQIHHAQKRNYEVVDMSNIVFLKQSVKDEMEITNANLMHAFDALITDYSSAYYEYILLNRPVAISIDDYPDYAEHMGFCIDFFDYVKGFYLKNFDDLKSFIAEVSKNIDSAQDGRNKSLKKIHKYVDANSTRRVVDFICGRVEL